MSWVSSGFPDRGVGDMVGDELYSSLVDAKIIEEVKEGVSAMVSGEVDVFWNVRALSHMT